MGCGTNCEGRARVEAHRAEQVPGCVARLIIEWERARALKAEDLRSRRAQRADRLLEAHLADVQPAAEEILGIIDEADRLRLVARHEAARTIDAAVLTGAAHQQDEVLELDRCVLACARTAAARGADGGGERGWDRFRRRAQMHAEKTQFLSMASRGSIYSDR